MNQQVCDPNRLSSFVRGELSPDDERELTAHLDQCESCGKALEHQVAEASVWYEASQLLGDAGFHDQDADFSVRETRDSQIQQVLSQLLPTDDPKSLGRIGGYEVTGVIGSGGMGVVLKAHDHALDRVVAVKVMAPHLAASGSARQRFAREAKAAAAVLHPNVIAIHGVSNEFALPYLVMPYVGGESLQKRIDAQGPLPLVDILRIGVQVAAGLAAAHEQGLVHRDIKPGNILMEQGVERVTITDFGLARAVDDASMTRSGVIAGTPQYMSPEQSRGEPIDARSDLFSLGSLVYAMCTGHSPFRAETSFGVMHRIMQDSPRPITEINPEIPVWLEGVVMKLLSKDAGDRIESAGEVAELLEGCLSHTQHPATTPLPEAVTELASKPPGNRLWSKFIAASVLLPLLLFAGVLIALELNKGTLRIESEADDVPIRIVQGREVVDELTVSKSGKSVRIAAGNYKIEIGVQIDGLALDDGSVTLQRGGNDVVRIVRVAPVTSALGDWPYGRLLKNLQEIEPPGGAPVIPPGDSISVAMGAELTKRLEAVPDGELDKWIAELERVTGDKLDGEMARQACRTYIVNHMSVLFEDGDWNTNIASRLFKHLQSLTPSEVNAWKKAFESLLDESIGQNDKEVFNGGPSYAVPLVLISVESLINDETRRLSSGTTNLSLASGMTTASVVSNSAVKYRERLAQLSKQDIASWRSKVDRFGGTEIDAAMNIILLDDYFVDETFQDGDFKATLGGMNPKRSDGKSTVKVPKNSTAPQTRLDFEAHPQDVIALQIGPTKHNKPLEWTSTSKEMGPFSVTITDEKVRLEDGSQGLGFTFNTQDAGGRTSTSHIAMAEGGPLPIGKFYLYKYKPNTLQDLKTSVNVGEIKYPDGTSAPVSVTARAANDTMVALPVRVTSTDVGDDQSAKQSSISPRRGTVNNLTRIINALHRYHRLHGRFPPATILGKYGKGGPPHSWRVELLPMLGYQGLYDRYNFKASWDSQRNLAVLAQMPDVYRSPLDRGDSTNTSYFGVVSDDISTRAAQLQKMREQPGGEREEDQSAYIGEDGNGAAQPQYEQHTPEATVFWKHRGASFIDMHDGTSNCIAVIEARRDIPWTKPEDIEYSANQPLPKFGGWFEQGVHAAFADGTVKFLANYNDEQTIRHLVTISDGQPVEPLLVRRLRIHGAIAIPDIYSEATATRKTYRVPDGPLLWIQPDQQSVITESDIDEVTATTDPNNPSAGDIVTITLTEEAGKRFLEATTWLSEQDVNGYMVITFDREILSAPKVIAPIENRLTITGNIDTRKLAEQIQAAMQEVESGDASPAPNANDGDLVPVEEAPTATTNSQRPNARTVVESYIAAALAGDIKLAAAMAKGSPASPKRIAEIPEFLNVQRLKISTVSVNDPANPTQALATSEAVHLDEEHKQPNGDQDGFLVLTLKLVEDAWLVTDIDFETESGTEQELKRFLEANPNSIGLPPAYEQGTSIPDTPTIEEATRQFNLQSAADRRNLFDPPIGELSVQQMRDAFAKTASEYREIGEHTIADSLQNIAETGKLPSDAISPVYASGPYGKDEDGKLTQKQIAPMLVLPDGRGGARLVPLRSAELIYNKHGRSSKRYGDLFEESQQEKASSQQGSPFDGVSKKPNSADFETRTTGPYGFLTAKHSASLEDALAAFNRMAAANEIGSTQKPLTAKEVIAAMRGWIDRKECSEETRAVFQQIIESNQLRPGDQLSFRSRQISEGHVFDVWEVRFGGDKNSTAWFKIRDVVLASRPKTPQELMLWSDYKDAMAESFSHFKRGTSKYRSKADQAKLRQLSDHVMQSSVAEGPAEVIDDTE